MSTFKEFFGQLTAGAIIGGMLSNLVGEELRTRLDLIPVALIRLAARHLPSDRCDNCREDIGPCKECLANPSDERSLSVRADRTSEWIAELNHIKDKTEGLPLTRFLRGLAYAAHLFLNVGDLSSAITGVHRRTLVLAASRRALAVAANLIAGWLCFTSPTFRFVGQIFTLSDPMWSAARGLAWWGTWLDELVLVSAAFATVCLGIGAFLHAAGQCAPERVRVLQRAARRLCVLGFAAFALEVAVCLCLVFAVSAGDSPLSAVLNKFHSWNSLIHYVNNEIPGKVLAYCIVICPLAGCLTRAVARDTIGPGVIALFHVLYWTAFDMWLPLPLPPWAGVVFIPFLAFAIVLWGRRRVGLDDRPPCRAPSNSTVIRRPVTDLGGASGGE
ncbi:hypothetical protein [Actinoallomurus sp. NPDC050550]|uniref:hypothetical protein n=1 Tax=Actinoallomurus sp. NPDC050550 TaxID=3154937 RepID=UPI0033CC8835